MSVPAVPATPGRRPFWGTDGWRNGSELWVATHLEPVWTLLRWLPGVRSATNRVLINRLVYKLDTRPNVVRSEEHTSELQSRQYLVCRLLLETKKPNLTHP